MGQGCGPLSGLRPDSDFQSDRRFLFGLDVRWDGHDRIREIAARVPLQQPTLGGLVLSLVSEYGGTLAADRPEICELHCTIARRSAGLPEVYFFAGVYFLPNYRHITRTALISVTNGMPRYPSIGSH